MKKPDLTAYSTIYDSWYNHRDVISISPEKERRLIKCTSKMLVKFVCGNIFNSLLVINGL
jgi:hypothetical protein